MAVVGQCEYPRLPHKLHNEYKSRDSGPHEEGFGVEEEESSVRDVQHVREIKHLKIN